MKKHVLSILTFFILAGCQDVIEVDVPVDDSRLVLDAVIRIDDITEPMMNLIVRASQTSSFFDQVQPAQLEEISIFNRDANASETLTEASPGSGVYVKEVPMSSLTQGELALNIIYKGQIYVAETAFVPSVPIDTLSQGEGNLFGGNETEIRVSFTDVPLRTDFYLFDFDFDQYLVSEDTFYPGQSFEFSYFYDEGLDPGMQVDISILGVDELFYNYMNQIIVQSGGDQGPFQTPAATVKGNIVNVTDKDNFALGYFAVCQMFSKSIIIE